MPYPARSNELDDPIVVDFPLRGQWFAYHTPAARIPSHGTDTLGQRFAYDFIRFDHRPGRHYHPSGWLRTLLLGVPTTECYGWGDPIHAPLDGEVVAAADGVPERARIHPIVDVVHVLRTALTFKPTDEWLRRVLGNHVVVRAGDVYAGFAHMTSGSVAVALGQAVSVGDVLAGSATAATRRRRTSTFN